MFQPVAVYPPPQPVHPEEVITQLPPQLLQPTQQHVHHQMPVVQLIIIGIMQLVVADRMSLIQLAVPIATLRRMVVIREITGTMIHVLVNTIQV